jgi:hypothetical protein
MEDTQNQPVETGEVVQQEVVQESPNQQNRNAVYAKYYEQTGQTQAQAAQSPEPVVETPVQVPPPEPVVEPPNPMIELITGLKTEIESLKERMAVQAQPPVTPQVPAPSGGETPNDWLQYLQQGKFDEGKKALEEEMERTVGARIRQQAVSETLETFRIQQEATKYVEDLRRENPDVIPLEDLVSIRVAQRMEKAKSEGKLKSAQDFLDVYKASAKAEVESARNIVHQLRADGKNEALVTKRTVLSATPLTPSAVNSERGVPQSQPTSPETTEDYITKRMKLSQRMKGMS